MERKTFQESLGLQSATERATSSLLGLPGLLTCCRKNRCFVSWETHSCLCQCQADTVDVTGHPSLLTHLMASRRPWEARCSLQPGQEMAVMAACALPAPPPLPGHLPAHARCCTGCPDCREHVPREEREMQLLPLQKPCNQTTYSKSWRHRISQVGKEPQAHPVQQHCQGHH